MILAEFRWISAVVLDVDGVLTDGSVQVQENGDQLRTFYVRDGYAMQAALHAGIQIWVITGGVSSGVSARLQGLGVMEVITGVTEKASHVRRLADQYQIDLQHIAYIGDDIPDIASMALVGVPACPGDAAEEVKALSRYISPARGGRGAVRDILEKILKVQGKWPSP